MDQQQPEPSSTDAAADGDPPPSGLAGEVESRLREYLAKAGEEYPAGCQADWLAGVVAERILSPPAAGDAAAAPPTLDSLVKLCVYLMENLADVSSAYEEFYSQQTAALRDESASAHAQVAALEDENGRLREQLHRRAEELRDSQAAVEALKSHSRLVAAGPGHQFDEAVVVAVEDDEDDDDDGCRRCARVEADAARRLAEAAVQGAALKADLADWEADMAEKVHQNVELAAQLEACQRLLARLGHAPATPEVAASRGVFGVGPLLRRK